MCALDFCFLPCHRPIIHRPQILTLPFCFFFLDLCALKDLSRTINKSIEEQMIAKCLADKPGILKIARTPEIKTRESIKERKTLEKKMRAAGSTELRR